MDDSQEHAAITSDNLKKMEDKYSPNLLQSFLVNNPNISTLPIENARNFNKLPIVPNVTIIPVKYQGTKKPMDIKLFKKYLDLTLNRPVENVENTEKSISDEYLNIVILNETYSRKNVVIRIMDYIRLCENVFLNDVLLEFYLNYYHAELLANPEQRTYSYVFSSFFYTALSRKRPVPTIRRSNSRYEKIKRWTKNVKIFEKDFIFIPINENQHWFMVVVCFPYLDGPVYFDESTANGPTEDDDFIYRSVKFRVHNSIDCDEADGNKEDLRFFNIDYTKKYGTSYENDCRQIIKKRRPIKQPCILVFDSLYSNPNQARVVATIREWLYDEFNVRHEGHKRDFSAATIKGGLVKVPQQYNGSDCGLFVMHYLEHFFEKPIVDYTFPITHLENWFHPDDVSKNSQKRRDLQSLIEILMKEKGTQLPEGIELPTLKFSETSD